VNAELDGLVEAYFRTIPVPERISVLGRIIRHVAEQLPVMGLYYSGQPSPTVSSMSAAGRQAPRALTGLERPRVGRAVNSSFESRGRPRRQAQVQGSVGETRSEFGHLLEHVRVATDGLGKGEGVGFLWRKEQNSAGSLLIEQREVGKNISA